MAVPICMNVGKAIGKAMHVVVFVTIQVPKFYPKGNSRI